MSLTNQIGRNVKEFQETLKRINISDLLFPFLCLLLIELIAFGINAKNTGIYQDEWITLSELHFAPHSLPKILTECFWNPRILIRPIEALHYGLIFYFFRENPLWYHIVCYVAELCSGWFLYLTLLRFIGDKTISLTAAILFLLYPTHDVTHYEIVASSLPVSMAFYTASLWLYLKGIDENKFSHIMWSGFAYFLSLYNYELCLPFALIYPLLYALKQPSLNSILKNLKPFIVFQIPPVLVALSMVIYRRWLFNIEVGYRYALVYDFSNFISVIWSGIIVSLSPYTFTFSAQMFAQAIKDGLSIISMLCLCIAGINIFINIAKDDSNVTPYRRIFSLIFLGAITILLSYTIYGFSPEHKPVIDAWLNRVNVGGSLGACLVIAGGLALLRNYFIVNYSNTQTFKILFAASISIISIALIVVDWQFAKPWIVSWQAQKELIGALKTKANEIHTGDSIILGGIARYSSKWVPVADGIWDFGGLVRTTLNNNDIHGTVVTERLYIDKDRLVDKYQNIVLGTFDYKHMILYAPNKAFWKRISSREEFIEQTKKLSWNIPCK